MVNSVKLRRALVDVAMGRRSADLVVRNGRWVCVQSGEIIPGTDVAVQDGHIAYVGADASHCVGPKTTVIDARQRFIVPGLLDAHVHVEPAMVTVTEFVRAVIPHGTTGVFIDPHEIANVSGLRGVRLMVNESARQPIHVWVQVPFFSRRAIITADCASLVPRASMGSTQSIGSCAMGELRGRAPFIRPRMPFGYLAPQQTELRPDNRHRTRGRAIRMIHMSGIRRNRGPSAGYRTSVPTGHWARSSDGFTLIELVAAVTIVAIMLAIGVPALRDMMINQRVRGAANDLYTDLSYARSEAIKRNAQVSVLRESDSWLTGWSVQVVADASTLRSQGAVGYMTLGGDTAGEGRLQG